VGYDNNYIVRYALFLFTAKYMRCKVWILILTFALMSCVKSATDTANKSAEPGAARPEMKLQVLRKKIVVGDFYGDNKGDTVFQHSYSRLTKTEIEYSPDVFHHSWDSVIRWFYDQDVEVYLLTSNSDIDTVHVGFAQGLYCLINVGDCNLDGKDEIAFVGDQLDHSRTNSGAVYSVCDNRWVMVMTFGIHEGSFDYTTGTPSIFEEIPDYLERINGEWLYRDFSEELASDSLEMKKLITDKCN
jgi:hypothetical protein